MSNPIQRAIILGLALSIGACAKRPIHVTAPCATAGIRLGAAWRSLETLLESPDLCDPATGAGCEMLRARIERLSADCPANFDVLMANALLAFESRNFIRAQQLLDELSAGGHINPDAAVMRARIALGQGNLQFAIKLLDQQIRHTGDHAGLRETYASALFLSGKLPQASLELDAARKLGAPPWRIAYGQGLIEESRGSYDEARRHYLEALQARPGWKQAESRLRALVVSGRFAASPETN